MICRAGRLICKVSLYASIYAKLKPYMYLLDSLIHFFLLGHKHISHHVRECGKETSLRLLIPQSVLPTKHTMHIISAMI